MGSAGSTARPIGAFVTDGAGSVRLTSVEPPAPAPDEVLVRVSAFGLNRGELTLAARLPPGSRIGWDVQGTVVDGAAGLTAGTPVIALARQDGWAENVAVPRNRIAALSDPAPEAAALGVAGLTALAALRTAGDVAGKFVLITGSTGGVGTILTQLTAAAHAEVGIVGRPAADGMISITALPGHQPWDPEQGADVVFDSVGGRTLGAAFDRLGPRGRAVITGNTTREPLVLPPDWGHRRPGVRIEYLHLFAELGRSLTLPDDLELLADRWQQDTLDPGVSRTESVDRLPSLLADLQHRRFAGKAVVTW